MKILRAKSAGFCQGVSLALERLNKEIAAQAPGAATDRIVTYGPIIHNPLVIRQYEALGVLCEQNSSALHPGDRVIIRAHGIPQEEEALLTARGAIIVDATCPKVKKAQKAIAKASKDGAFLLLFGEEKHPEVLGLISYAAGPYAIFGSLEELAALGLNREKEYFLAAQTTQDAQAYEKIQEYAAATLGRPVTALKTICDATSTRQEDVRAICREAKMMVVVGGMNSGNTRRLAEVARSENVLAIHVEQVHDLSEEQKRDLARCGGPIGLTAGASTPEQHINVMEDFLSQLAG